MEIIEEIAVEADTNNVKSRVEFYFAQLWIKFWSNYGFYYEVLHQPYALQS